ncbi:MAG: HNH endonuclease [Candidatus Dadabacteria bacterium]|nr:HNH endonuclease [Candidatus Dadabacteria bacterium]
MLTSPVLVLNRYFFPITVTSVKRAFVMLYCGAAKAVAGNYQTFDFESWAEISAIKDKDAIKTVSRVIRIPRVIVLLRYDHMPRKEAKFNRINIFRRDEDSCQYCGKKYQRSELTIDHVIPRSLGGRSMWENVVCCCMVCNRKKGGRTPEAARMRLIGRPKKPVWSPLSNISLRAVRYKEWEPFLSFVDVSYWNVELEE